MPYIDLSAAPQAAPTLTAGDPLTSVGETLASLLEELQLQLGGRGDIDSTRYTKLINWAYLDLCTSLDISELHSSYTQSIVVDQPLYALARSVRAIEGISIVDPSTYSSTLGGIVFSAIDLSSYRKLPDLTDEPNTYFRNGNIMALYPTPKTVRTINIDYMIRPAPLVDDTDSPILPEEWHEGLLLNARRKSFRAVLEFDKAMLADDDYTDFVQKRIDTGTIEDAGKIVRSSVPVSGRNLYRTFGRRGY